jgi:hypothetical protein
LAQKTKERANTRKLITIPDNLNEATRIIVLSRDSSVIMAMVEWRDGFLLNTLKCPGNTTGLDPTVKKSDSNM